MLLNAINVDRLELSTQILIKSALDRGYEVDVLDEQDNFIRLRKGQRVEYVKQATRTSLDTYIAPLIMENKEVTKVVLREQGISVPEGQVFASPQEAERYYDQCVDHDIVIKPKSTNFGLGVTILKNVQSKTHYMEAVETACHHDEYVIIEQFIAGREYRFLVIGEETVAVLYRVPANVVGDGVQTIAQLVEQKNKDPLRGEGYVTPLEKIKLGETEKLYLQAQGLDFKTIPAKGETVYLRENSNISTGGDSIDMTDDMPAYYKQIAVRAAQAVGARICGADIIIDDLAAAPSDDRYSVIELNFNPALHIHNFPYRGVNREVEKKLLDLFESK